MACGDNVVLRLLLLEHEPLHLDVVAGVAPVAFGAEVAEEELLLKADLDAGEAASDLAGDECLAAEGRLVVEEDAVAGVDAVGFAVVDADPVGIHFCYGVRRTRVERSGLLLGGLLDEAVELAGAGLVELCFLFEAEDADGFEEAEGAQGVGVGGVLWLFEGDLDVGLGAEVVDLVGLDLLDDLDEGRGVGEVAVVEKEFGMGLVGVFVDVIDASGVEEGGAALDAVDLVAFGEEEFGEIGSVLSGNSGDEGFLQSAILLRVPGWALVILLEA